MSTATRTADPTGAVRTDAGAVAVDSLVVIDLDRARRQYGALREAFPWVDVHYDVTALAHPDLLAAIAGADGGFEVTHEQALPALVRAGADAGRTLYAAPVSPAASVRAAHALGVRRFAIDGMRDLTVLAALGSPATLLPLLRLGPLPARRPAHRAEGGSAPEEALRIARAARDLGLPLAGLSLALPARATAAEYVAEIVAALALMADVEAETGRRLSILDLGDGFPGRAATRPSERAELARAIRGIVAPATSGLTVTASAGRAITAGCLTIVGQTVEHDADPARASECIDAGAEVVVLREDTSRAVRLPFFRGRDGGAHRVLHPRGLPTWSPAD